MSENGKSSYKQKGSSMKRFSISFFLVALSVSGLGQAAQKPESAAPPAQTQTPPPANAAPSDTPATGSAPAVASATTGAANVDNARYIIGSEDSLSISVWKEPALSGSIPVRPDGMISLALVGDLQASGRTPMQLADDISVKLKKYIQDPVVTVVVMAVNSQRIFMVGEVGHVGPIMMTPNMTALQAIATAGGLSPYANSKKIYILRNEDGKQQKIPFNYKQAVKGENLGPSLKPGDTVVVP
jgi:polysaccharide biosynthesis/export protein